jgi:small redox-active disulfide protein 2
MIIEIFGLGCAACRKLESNVRKAVGKTGIKADIVKIDKIDEFIKRGVLFPPALFIDGKEIASGRIPTVDAIVKIIKSKY